MGRNICISEFGKLLRGGDAATLDRASLSVTDWEWLLHNGSLITSEGPALFRPVKHGGRQALQVLNYVGLIELPSGDVLEVLPKISEHDTIETVRKLLLKMLARVNDIPFARFEDADLTTFNRPLLEVLIGRFLATAQHLINRGLSSQYVRITEEQPFLRGKLLVHEQLKLPPHRRTKFPIEHDEYLLSRPVK